MFGRSGLIIETGALGRELWANGIAPVFTRNVVKERRFYEAFGEQLGAMALLGDIAVDAATVQKFRERSFDVKLRPPSLGFYRFEIGENRKDGRFDPKAPKFLVVRPYQVRRGKGTIIEFKSVSM